MLTEVGAATNRPRAAPFVICWVAWLLLPCSIAASRGVPIEFNRNENQNAVRNADHDEHESDAVLIVQSKPQILTNSILLGN